MSDALAATPDTDTDASAIDSAVAASSSYELLKKRLQAQGDALLAKAAPQAGQDLSLFQRAVEDNGKGPQAKIFAYCFCRF